MKIKNKNNEFKREYVEDIKKTIIAFANTDGGELLIGVDDDGTAVGLDNTQDVLLRATTAISLLRNMLNKGLLTTEGNGKNLKYKRI